MADDTTTEITQEQIESTEDLIDAQKDQLKITTDLLENAKKLGKVNQKTYEDWKKQIDAVAKKTYKSNADLKKLIKLTEKLKDTYDNLDDKANEALGNVIKNYENLIEKTEKYEKSIRTTTASLHKSFGTVKKEFGQLAGKMGEDFTATMNNLKKQVAKKVELSVNGIGKVNEAIEFAFDVQKEKEFYETTAALARDMSEGNIENIEKQYAELRKLKHEVTQYEKEWFFVRRAISEAVDTKDLEAFKRGLKESGVAKLRTQLAQAALEMDNLRRVGNLVEFKEKFKDWKKFNNELKIAEARLEGTVKYAKTLAKVKLGEFAGSKFAQVGTVATGIGFALAALKGYLDKTRNSVDMFLESGVDMNMNFTQVHKKTLELTYAYTQLAYSSSVLGVANEELNNMMYKISTSVGNTDSTVLDYTKDVAYTAKFMQMDMATATEAVVQRMERYNLTQEDAIKDFKYLNAGLKLANEGFKTGKIRTSEWTKFIESMSEKMSKFTKDTQVVNLVVGKMVKDLGKSGFSQKAALDYAEKLVDTLSNPPDWIKSKIGVAIGNQLGNLDRLAEGMKEFLPDDAYNRILALMDARKKGLVDDYHLSLAIQEVTAGTEMGIAGTLKYMSKMMPNVAVLKTTFGMLSNEATIVLSTMKDMGVSMDKLTPKNFKKLKEKLKGKGIDLTPKSKEEQKKEEEKMKLTQMQETIEKATGPVVTQLGGVQKLLETIRDNPLAALAASMSAFMAAGVIYYIQNRQLRQALEKGLGGLKSSLRSNNYGGVNNTKLGGGGIGSNNYMGGMGGIGGLGGSGDKKRTKVNISSNKTYDPMLFNSNELAKNTKKEVEANKTKTKKGIGLGTRMGVGIGAMMVSSIVTDSFRGLQEELANSKKDTLSKAQQSVLTASVTALNLTTFGAPEALNAMVNVFRGSAKTTVENLTDVSEWLENKMGSVVNYFSLENLVGLDTIKDKGYNKRLKDLSDKRDKMLESFSSARKEYNNFFDTYKDNADMVSSIMNQGLDKTIADLKSKNKKGKDLDAKVALATKINKEYNAVHDKLGAEDGKSLEDNISKTKKSIITAQKKFDNYNSLKTYGKEKKDIRTDQEKRDTALYELELEDQKTKLTYLEGEKKKVNAILKDTKAGLELSKENKKKTEIPKIGGKTGFKTEVEDVFAKLNQQVSKTQTEMVTGFINDATQAQNKYEDNKKKTEKIIEDTLMQGNDFAEKNQKLAPEASVPKVSNTKPPEVSKTDNVANAPKPATANANKPKKNEINAQAGGVEGDFIWFKIPATDFKNFVGNVCNNKAYLRALNKAHN